MRCPYQPLAGLPDTCSICGMLKGQHTATRRMTPEFRCTLCGVVSCVLSGLQFAQGMSLLLWDYPKAGVLLLVTGGFLVLNAIRELTRADRIRVARMVERLTGEENQQTRMSRVLGGGMWD